MENIIGFYCLLFEINILCELLLTDKVDSFEKCSKNVLKMENIIGSYCLLFEINILCELLLTDKVDSFEKCSKNGKYHWFLLS
jgi:glucose-6-phosphate-specific signal transduction histidine kinase